MISMLLAALVVSVGLNIYHLVNFRGLVHDVRAVEGQIACIRVKLVEVGDATASIGILVKSAGTTRQPRDYNVTEEHR